MKVPFLDLKAQYLQIKDEVHAALDHVMETSAFVQGEAVRHFEELFAAHHGARFCIATSSGTSALHVALLAMGVGAGDEVIVPVNTFIATAEAVSYCGARPVFVDMAAADHNIDPALIEQAITPRTKAIIPVHLFGQPARMDTIAAIARRHGLGLLEDCAQSHDAEFGGRKVGTFGHGGAFSFYPGKNLGSYGEGGAVVTNDEQLAASMRMLHDHGSSRKYYHDVVGYNYRMQGFQGAVLGVKMKHLVAWTEARRAVARRYQQALSGLPVVVQPEQPGVRHVYHQMVIRVPNRDAVMREMEARGVGVGIHYPIPLHLAGAYASLGYRAGDFPAAEAAAAEILSLPIYPELTPEQIDYVVASLKACPSLSK